MSYVKRVFTIIAFSASLLLSSCKDDDENPTQEDKSVSILLAHKFETAELKLQGPYYITAAGDSFQPTTIVYHINDFVLIDGNGVKQKISNSYFMADMSNIKSLTLPLGKYSSKTFKSIEFTIGVEDSATNANGLINSLFTAPMYWAMNSGYINFKLEGNSPKAPQGSVALHVGGYLEPYKLSRRIHIDLGETLKTEMGNAVVTINVDLAIYFDGVNQIKLNEIHLIHAPNDEAKKIADNLPGMFSVGKTTYN